MAALVSPGPRSLDGLVSHSHYFKGRRIGRQGNGYSLLWIERNIVVAMVSLYWKIKRLRQVRNVGIHITCCSKLSYIWCFSKQYHNRLTGLTWRNRIELLKSWPQILVNLLLTVRVSRSHYWQYAAPPARHTGSLLTESLSCSACPVYRKPVNCVTQLLRLPVDRKPVNCVTQLLRLPGTQENCQICHSCYFTVVLDPVETKIGIT